MASQTPTASWAQREDAVWLTVQLEHPENLKVEVENQRLRVSALQKGVPFALDLPLHAEIDTAQSRFSQHRFLDFYLKKAEAAKWPRLHDQSLKRPAWLKVDWSRWVDSDAEDEENAAMQRNNPAGFDFSDMQDFSKFQAGMAADSDSDDEPENAEEDLPDLVDDVDASVATQ